MIYQPLSKKPWIKRNSVFTVLYWSYTIDYSGAVLYNCPTLRRNRITMIFLRLQLWSQNDGLNGFFFSLRWSVPCFRNQFFAKRQFSSSWSAVSKWPLGKQNGSPLFSGMIPRKTGSENSYPMEDLCWMVSFDPIGTHWRGFNVFQWGF